jgi:hypothetical protein
LRNSRRVSRAKSWCWVESGRENFEEEGSRALLAVARAVRATARGDLVIGRVVFIHTLRPLRQKGFRQSKAGWKVSNGGAIASPTERYLKYRITLTTTNPTLTSILDDITFTWS